MTDIRTAPGAHGTNPHGDTNHEVKASAETISEIKSHFATLKTQLLGNLASLSVKETALDGKLKERSKKLYGIEDYNTKKSYSKKILLVVAMFIVATAELPLNLKGFEVLGMNQNFTYLLAIIVGIILAGLAELSGFCIKRGESTGKIMMWVFGALAFAGGVVIIEQIAQLRHDYLVHMNKTAWDVNSQVLLAGAMYLGGVITGYLTTTGVRNKKAEDVFLNMTAELRTVQKDIKETKNRLENLTNEQKAVIDNAHKQAADLVAQQQKEDQKAEEKRLAADEKARKAEEKAARKKKKNEENGEMEEEEVTSEETTHTTETKVDEKQHAFETTLTHFNGLLQSAQEKVTRHDDASGEDLRDMMADDLTELEATFSDLEIKSAMYPAGADQLVPVKESFETLKTTISEKA